MRRDSLAILLWVLLPLLLLGEHIYFAITTNGGFDLALVGHVIHTSALPLAGYSIALALAIRTRLAIPELFWKAILTSYIVVVVIDVAIRHIFQMRLEWDDILVFADFQAISSLVASPSLDSYNLLLMIIAITCAVVYLLSERLLVFMFHASDKRYVTIIALFLCLALIPLTPPVAHDSWTARHVITHNLARPIDITYPPGFQRLNSIRAEKPLATHHQLPDKVIVIIWESLSWPQSSLKEYGGVHDLIPNFDLLTHEPNAILYTNFMANSYHTLGGLYAMLTADLPIPPTRGYYLGGASPLHSLAPENGYENTHVKDLQEQGYTVSFHFAGDIDFSKKGDLLERFNFDTLEDGTHPYYTDKPRYMFGATADEYLFDRVSQYIASEQPSDGKFVAYVETATTHPPYISPTSSRSNQYQEVFRYTDAQVGKFISKLKDDGFFEDGVVVIMSDHRDRQPLTSYERASGLKHARTPMLILGADNFFTDGTDGLAEEAVALNWTANASAWIDSGFRSQIDWPNTLSTLASGKESRALYRTNLLKKAPTCILRHPGNSRNLVLAFCPNKDAEDGHISIRSLLLQGPMIYALEAIPEDERSVLKELTKTIHETRLRCYNTDNCPTFAQASPYWSLIPSLDVWSASELHPIPVH